MYRSLKIAVVIPAYNEEKLIGKSISTLPEFVDYIIPINDASKDDTLKILHGIAKENKKVAVLDNPKNGGIGFSIKNGILHALTQTDADVVAIISGDAQCPPDRIQPMLDEFIDRGCDYVKGNRFYDRKALASMPTYRRIGNTFISMLTKFSTGYYSVSDTTMGFGVLSRRILEALNFDFVKDRYDYDISMLVALSIANARIKDVPVPAIYGEETSTIKFWPTVFRVLKVIWLGFWQRMYYKYIFFSLHPVAIFLFGGLLLSLAGWIFALYLVFEKAFNDLSPTSGTVMLSVLPIILGFQMLLTALMMDMANENKP
jgi:glycosyltransferase involved in cell wall biosynthesis